MAASRACLAVFLCLQLLDFVTTVAGLRLGAEEMSPFIRQLMLAGPVLGVAAAKAIAIGLAGVCVLTRRAHVIRWINYWYAALVAWNVSVLIRA